MAYKPSLKYATLNSSCLVALVLVTCAGCIALASRNAVSYRVSWVAATASQLHSTMLVNSDDAGPAARSKDAVQPTAALTTGVSGKRFTGEKTRTYAGSIELARVAVAEADYVQPTGDAKMWAVCTTVFEPSPAILRLIALKSWSVVIVGDVGGAPFHLNASHAVFLGVDDQKQLSSKYSALLELLPWRHFGRKNIGYLYAVMNGADVIWDFDDDNVLKNDQELAVPTDNIFQVQLDSGCDVFNPYPAMGDPSGVDGRIPPTWPRGLPLDTIGHACNYTMSPSTMQRVAVVQSLADNDPDVDAIFRLTRGVPFKFDNHKRKTLVLPNAALAPWNAQATLVLQPAFWGLLLPVTVSPASLSILPTTATPRSLLGHNDP